MKPTVVLLHGLARTHKSMRGLRAHIEKAGYQTWARTYPSRRLSVDELAGVVAEWIAEDLGDVPVVGVTHSLGGVLVRHIGDRVNWRGVVMLAPPNRGSRVAAALRFHPLYRWFYGPAGQEVASAERWPDPPEPFAIIAGTSGASIGNPPSWALSTLKLLPRGELHDGTVSVAETKLEGMSAFAEVPASHTWIMNHPKTVELVLEFIARQRF